MLYALCIASLLSLGSAIADVPPTTTPAATSSPLPENPKITALAKSQFIAFQKGKINRALYTPGTSSQFSDTVLAQASTQLTSMGDLKTIKLTAIQQISSPPDTAYIYLLTCDKGSLRETLVLTADGLIDGIYFGAA